MVTSSVGGPRAISFINADLGNVSASSLRVVRPFIQSIGENPAPSDLIVDLGGDRLLPGLINAHDHLQLNGLRRIKYRLRHANVKDWIDDISRRRSTDAELVAWHSVPLRTHQVHGGLKNILSGVTTVAHHDPIDVALLASDFPTRVVARIGWAHSLAIDGELRVQRSYQDSPREWPWAIHAAEGVDFAAAHEFDRLDALGCVGPNTLIVHGVGMNSVQHQRLINAGAGLIWCPSSNMHLFGRTPDVTALASLHRVALGTDSRMSGERDLLSELSSAHKACELDTLALEAMVTCHAARLLGLEDCGTLEPGARADLIILPGRRQLTSASRADIRLVMLNGQIRLGDTHYVPQLAPAQQCVEFELDGHTKLMDHSLATQLLQLQVREAGLNLRRANWRAA